VDEINLTHYDEMAIFWLGRITPTENYADVRTAYSDTLLELRLNIFDRLLWYDTTPSPAELEAWDAVTIYLDLDGNTGGTPDTDAYRFVSQLDFSGMNRSNRQAVYRGNGTGWSPAAVPFTTLAPWRGVGLNNTLEDRGWEAVFEIPFAGLGLSGPPAPGTVWGLSIVVHDRDDDPDIPIVDQLWPETFTEAGTWGELHFGESTYSPPPATNLQTVVIREGLGGADVPDAGLGGTIDNLCPNDPYHLWNVWGNTNYGSVRGVNIQNQRDVADWPCFSKYYVKFPLSSVPPGRAIVSATLTLHHWGNSGDWHPGQPNTASPSFMHVLTVPSGWNEATVTWNNDPQPLENVSQAPVPVVTGCASPCVPRDWDVSGAVAKAFVAGGTISFAVYSTDSARHSGKFFTASDAEEWQAEGRPTLTIVWGEP
jgi:hypothetical protein